MANVTIDEDDLKKMKFALVFLMGDYEKVIKPLSLSRNKAKQKLAYRLESLRLAAYEIVEKYSNNVDIEDIISSDKVDWETVKKLIR